ncbi:MAG TPA: type VI secretion system tip protein VgrG, partial [Ghiorsea sp.]|nr:type VI secretion system tip protein VgrG [Ghiorsea sp.]
RSTKDDKSSCWVRVSQAWAGKGWGFVSIPRIGQEVIVDYLEGDPDQPIVVGRTYHEGNMPPYSLPGNKTQTGLKSRSSKGGSAANFNEMRFEDLKGKEQVYIQAEKNQDNLVKNDETTDVWHDRTEHIGHDESITIDNDRTEVVHHDETITIDNDRTETVHHDEQIRIDNNRSKSIGVNESIDIGNNRDESVGNNESWSVGNNQNTSVGNSQSLKVGKKQSINIGKSKMETIGVSNMLSVGAGMQVSVGAVLNTTVGISNTEQVGFLKHIIAGKQIQFVCGGSSITLNSDGSIKIAGKSIEIAGSDSIKLTSAIIDLN